MAIGCGAKCAKFLLIVFNFIFWLSGVAILGVGVWICVDRTIVNYLEVLAVDPEDTVITYAAYVLIAIGVFVFIVGFFGCCGAVKESKCMLGLYIFCMVIVMAGELAAGVLAILYRAKVEDQLQGHMVETIKEKYKNGTAIALSWDFAQIQLKCCGALGPMDYQNSMYTNKTGHSVPVSCCVAQSETTKFDDFKPKDYTKCQQDATTKVTSNENVYSVGCSQKLQDWFKSHIVIVIGIGLGIACLEIFGFIFAICLCRNVGEEE